MDEFEKVHPRKHRSKTFAIGLAILILIPPFVFVCLPTAKYLLSPLRADTTYIESVIPLAIMGLSRPMLTVACIKTSQEVMPRAHLGMVATPR